MWFGVLFKAFPHTNIGTLKILVYHHSVILNCTSNWNKNEKETHETQFSRERHCRTAARQFMLYHF